MTTRRCGSCSLCCKLLAVSDGDFWKPRGQWCSHCLKDKGCGIYETRPSVCRNYVCNWLIDPHLPDYFWPRRSHMVLGYNLDHSLFYVEVDPAYPLVWQQEPYVSHLRLLAKVLLTGDKPVPMLVRVGKKVWSLTPTKATPIRVGVPAAIKRVGENDWEVRHA